MAATPHIGSERTWPPGSDTHLFELRRYRVAAGRLQDEIDRALSCILPSDDGEPGLFARHGIPTPIGFWRVISGPTLPCVLFLYRWPDAASRAKAFESFYADEEWKKERARTNDGSEIVDRLDDLLLVGRAADDLSAAAVHEFCFGEAPADGTHILASLLPLCGRRVERLSIIGHASIGAAMDSSRQASGTPLLCQHVDMR